MKYSKSIFKILIVFLLIAQNSFAGSTPIPGIGIVVKKNPGGGQITVNTGSGGGFSTQLSEGVYDLSFLQEQLQTSINGIIKADYPKSSYQYDGSGVEMVLDNSKITVNSKATKGNVFAVDSQNSITITVPKGGATLSGKLSWNDAVMTNSISCPDGFIMQKGECVPINNVGNQQTRTEGKTRGKVIKSGNDGMRSVSGSTSENANNSCGPSLTVSLNANGGTSSSTGVDNSFSFNPSLGIAIHWKNFGIGLDAGTFSTKPDFDFDTYAAPLQNLDFLTTTNTKNDWTSTYFMLGPQYTVTLSPSQNKESGRHTPFHNKLTFTLALKGGLTINKAPEFSVVDKSTPPKNIASYTAPQDYKTNTISLKPSIGFDYWINENIALTANAQYLMQTGQKEFTTGYRDLTNVNLAPPISPDQFQKNIATAPKVMTNTKGPENYMSFGFGITYRFNKGGGDCDDSSDDIIGNTSEKGITENGLKKNDFESVSNETQRKGIKENGLKKNEIENVINEVELQQIAEIVVNFRKGWDGSIKGNKVENAANEADVKAIAETLVNLARKGWDGSIKGNKIENATKEANVKTIAETLVNIRKGWDGSVKGNKVENVANEADVKAISETFVNLRKGWDGTVKGGSKTELKTTSDETQRKGIRENGLKKNEVETVSDGHQKIAIKEQGVKKSDVETTTNEAEVKQIAETLVNFRKGWDGSIKGNKVENIANEADIKVISETLVNLRKGWDGSIKGNVMKNVGPEESGDNIESIHIKVTITTKVGFTDCGSPGHFFCIGVEIGIGALRNNQNLGDLPLEKDQLITNTNVEIVNGNTIKVTSIGVKSTISEKTMSEFKNKTQKNKEFTLDHNVLKEICKTLNLNTPIEPVIFKAEDQKYEVINTTKEGKEIQILEIHQKTKIKIDGKEYTLSMLTTSGQL